MDQSTVDNLGVSLRMADQLQKSLNSSNSKWRNVEKKTYSPSYYSLGTVESTLFENENDSFVASVGSSKSWPTRSSRKRLHIEDGVSTSSYSADDKCPLLSHKSGSEICPFDGSNYVLTPFTKSFSEPRYDSKINNTSQESSIMIPAFGFNEKLDNNVKELKLSSDLWPQISSLGNKDYSIFGNTSSCRHTDEHTASYRHQVDQPSFTSTNGSQEGCNSVTFRKQLEDKYHSYREQYLANSPVEELHTLNSLILNVRKWLQIRNESLKIRINEDFNNVQKDTSIIETLISEAKIKQEGVDVLLDRCHRFLSQHANIVLEVDLENLVFLWNSYVDKLKGFYCDLFKGEETKLRELHSLITPVTVSSCSDTTGCVDVDNSNDNCERLSWCNNVVNDSFEEYDSINKGVACEFDSTYFEFDDFDLSNTYSSTSRDINCVDSGALSLTDLSTSDNNFDITDLSTTICCDTSSQEGTQFFGDHLIEENYHKKYSNGKPFDTHSDNSPFFVSENHLYNLPHFEIPKMEIEEVKDLPTPFGLGGEGMDVEQNAALTPKGGSPCGSFEGLASFFDKSSLQVMDCIQLGSPTEPKRRRKLLDTPSSVSSISSRSGSPTSLKDSECSTPTGTLTRGDRQNDLWRAIGNIDSFLLDKDLLDACKSTENDLSTTDEDCESAPSVSFAEFLQQYKELIDWLNQMHKVVQREVTSLSEKYMNQAYHEEMLERSPRREFLNTYSLQVLVRYPNMSDQISARMNRLNAQWTAVEEAIAPKHGKHDEDSMLQDLECDLNNLRRWLNAIESRLLPLTIQADWTDAELEERLVSHQALQRDIESHNKVINAVLKLSERLENDSGACGTDKERDSLQLVALNLERRWHGIWLQSLEWQCRLEEAIGRRKGIYRSGFDFSAFSLPVLDESLFKHCTSQDISDQGLITLDDDSLLFIGNGRDFDYIGSYDHQSLEIDSNSSCNVINSAHTYASDSDLKDFDSNTEDESSSICDEVVKKEATSLQSLPKAVSSKPDSPLGKRRYTEPHSEGSPAKKGPLSSSGEIRSLSPDSLHASLVVSSEDSLADQSSFSCFHNGKTSSPIPIDDLKILSVKRSLFDRSSGDSANISETDSKMGDSPPSPFPDHSSSSAAVSNSEADIYSLFVPSGVAKADIKDVGYSSENQSNDEVETMRQQIDIEYKFPGKCELASDGPLGDKVLFPSVKTRSNYYQMTHVTDVDSTDKTDNGDTTDSGPEKVKESVVPVSVNSKSSGTDEFSATVKDIYLQLNSYSDMNENDSDMQVNGVNPQVNQIFTLNSCSQTESPVNGFVPIHQLVDFSESDSAPEGKKSVRYLIEHAEDLVRPSTSPKKSRPLSPQKAISCPNPIIIPSPCKQTQTEFFSTVESSCDASGEDNSDQEGKQERFGKEDISTGTDDAEDRTLFDSVVNLGSATESTNNISTEEVTQLSAFHISPVVDTPRLRKQTGQNSRRRSKKDRPWSVVGFQDSTNSKKDNCVPIVAASESAINHLHCQTDSDSCSTSTTAFLSSHSSTFPRASAHKRRTVSLSTQPSYYNIVTATQDLTTTTAAIQGSISSFPAQPSDVSSGAELSNSRHNRLRRSRHQLKSSNQELDATRCYSTDSYDSAEAESESETADEYLTACMEVCSSEGDDVHNVSGSLSEHSTWDNYQVIYPTGSEDPGEDLLVWEPQDDLEFEDDFQLSSGKSIVNQAMTNKSKSKLKKQEATEDSDSDLEDFHDILDQSEQQLKLANKSLHKKRNDPMGTSLHPEPYKYGEILETYDTNIKCLETICQHLTSDDVTEADVKRVQGLMEQWGKVHALASERHSQSTILWEMRDQMTAMKDCIKDVSKVVTFDQFSSAGELNDTILILKKKQDNLFHQASRLKDMRSQLTVFSSQYPTVSVDKYKQEITCLSNDTNTMLEKITSHTESLENNRNVWLEYLESQQELDSWLAADRERLYSLLTQREFGSAITKRDVLKELETLQLNLCKYESKLAILQTMHAKLTKTSNEEAQRLLLSSLADLRNQLFVVSERCKQVYKDAEDDEELNMEQCPEIGELAIQASALHELMSASTDRAMERFPEASYESMDSESAINSESLPASKVCMSWLRSVPVQVVSLVFVAGLVCALDPDILERLTNFSISFTPELRYVNGPPAV